MEIDVINALVSDGPVAILALLIFIMYRKDRLSSEKRLSNLLSEDQKTRERHTEVLTQLITLVQRMNGKR